MSLDPRDPTRDEVLALYGAALHAAQDFEEALVGLLGVRKELSIIERDAFDELDAAYLKWEKLFSWTAGHLSKELRLQAGLADDVERAVAARNLLAHHYLRDHARHFESGPQRAAMASRLRHSADHFQEVRARLEVERLVAMHDAGLTDDEVTTPNEARRLRYYDPGVDDDVPPEPFADI
jgi:hypothetical protein